VNCSGSCPSNESCDWDCQCGAYPNHRGNDFGVGGFPGMDAGRDVTAAATGTVGQTPVTDCFARCGETIRWQDDGRCSCGGGYGNNVRIDHPDGKRTIYAHLKQFSVVVARNQTVACGTKLAEVGSSGQSTGPHLHFEVQQGGVAQDPFAGSCSTAPSLWTSQGTHGGLPTRACGSSQPKFSAGDSVVVSGAGSLLVRSPNPCDTAITSKPDGATGIIIIGGPSVCAGYTRWKVRWSLCEDTNRGWTRASRNAIH